MAALLRDHYGKSVWDDVDVAHAFGSAIQYLLLTPVYGPLAGSSDGIWKTFIKKKGMQLEPHNAPFMMGFFNPDAPPVLEGEELPPNTKAKILGVSVGKVVVEGRVRNYRI